MSSNLQPERIDHSSTSHHVLLVIVFYVCYQANLIQLSLTLVELSHWGKHCVISDVTFTLVMSGLKEAKQNNVADRKRFF